MKLLLHKPTGQTGTFVKEYTPTGHHLTTQIELTDGGIYFAPSNEFEVMDFEEFKKRVENDIARDSADPLLSRGSIMIYPDPTTHYGRFELTDEDRKQFEKLSEEFEALVRKSRQKNFSIKLNNSLYNDTE